MKAIILNYTDTSVYVAELPEDCVTPEKTESYLSDELGFHLDEINYMTTNDDCPVYTAERRNGFADGERIAIL